MALSTRREESEGKREERERDSRFEHFKSEALRGLAPAHRSSESTEETAARERLLSLDQSAYLLILSKSLPPSPSDIDTECVHFSLNATLLPTWPFPLVLIPSDETPQLLFLDNNFSLDRSRFDSNLFQTFFIPRH